MVFYCSLSYSKSPQVSRILLSILTDLNNAEVWMVFTLALISNSFSPFTNSLMTVPNAPITIGFTVILMFHCYFCSLERSLYLSFFLLSFNFSVLSAGSPKSTIRLFIFFCCCWLSLSFVVWPRLGDLLIPENFVRLIIIIFTPWEFFTSALTDSLLQESGWQQISASVQDSSQYSGRSPQYSSLDYLDSSSNFSVLESFYQSFSDCTKSTNYNLYNRHFQVLQVFHFSSKIEVFILLFTFFQFYSIFGQPGQQSPQFWGSIFCVDYLKVWLSGRD